MGSLFKNLITLLNEVVTAAVDLVQWFVREIRESDAPDTNTTDNKEG